MKNWQIGSFARQGDVRIVMVSSIPKGNRKPQADGCLAYGEVTGHAHKVSSLEDAGLFHVGDGMFLSVGENGVNIIHEEHDTINLPAGDFQVIIQKEYAPEAIRNVQD